LGVTRASSSVVDRLPGVHFPGVDGIIEPAAGDLSVEYPKAISWTAPL